MIENLNIDYGGDMTLRYISFKSPEVYEDFREKMLLHNSISGYLKLDVVYEQGEKEYRFDVSDKKSLRETLAEKYMDEKNLLNLLKELERIFIKGKSFMLEEGNYILHPDAMYFSPEGRVHVCYLPGYEKNVQEQLCDLLEFLMNCVDVADRRSVYAVYSTYVAARDGSCTFGSLINLLESNMESLGKMEENLPGRGDLAEGTPVLSHVESTGINRFFHLGEKEKRQLGHAALVAGFILIVLYFIFS